jgi:hypothetical protein
MLFSVRDRRRDVHQRYKHVITHATISHPVSTSNIADRPNTVMSRSPVYADDEAIEMSRLRRIKRKITKPRHNYVQIGTDVVSLRDIRKWTRKKARTDGLEFVILKRDTTATEIPLESLVLAPWGIVETRLVASSEHPHGGSIPLLPTPQYHDLPPTPEAATPVGIRSPGYNGNVSSVEVRVLAAWTWCSAIQINKGVSFPVEVDDNAAVVVYAGDVATPPRPRTCVTLTQDTQHLLLRWNNLKKGHTPFYTDGDMETVVSDHWSGMKSLVRCCLSGGGSPIGGRPESRVSSSASKSTRRRKYAVLRYSDRGYTCLRCGDVFRTMNEWKSHYPSSIGDRIPTQIPWSKFGYDEGEFVSRKQKVMVDNPVPMRPPNAFEERRALDQYKADSLEEMRFNERFKSRLAGALYSGAAPKILLFPAPLAQVDPDASTHHSASYTSQ